MRTGAMLASSVMPSRTRHSSAHSDRSLIDHSGARNPSMRSTPAARNAATLCLTSATNASRVEIVGAEVQVPVRPDVVTARANLPDQPRIALGDPAENEERCARARAIELVEQRPRGEHDARRQAFPVLPCESGSKPQMWNHSSTSTVMAFARGRGPAAPVDRRLTWDSWWP